MIIPNFKHVITHGIVMDFKFKQGSGHFTLHAAAVKTTAAFGGCSLPLASLDPRRAPLSMGRQAPFE